MRIRNSEAEELPYNLSHYALHSVISCPLTHSRHQHRRQVFKVLQHLDDLHSGTCGSSEHETLWAKWKRGKVKDWLTEHMVIMCQGYTKQVCYGFPGGTVLLVTNGGVLQKAVTATSNQTEKGRKWDAEISCPDSVTLGLCLIHSISTALKVTVF